jgi:histidine triad (HIT) family protein
MGECSFCEIISGLETARIVCEGRDWISFFPINPAVVGHTLVIPKAHIRDIWSLDEDTAAVVMNAVLAVSRAIKLALNPEGLNIVNSAGRVASQTVFHLHFHVVPRWREDAMGDIWPAVARSWPETLLDETAALVRVACVGML